MIISGWRVYARFMRYPDGGGLTAAGQVRREKVRLQVAQMYKHDVSPVRVAHRLRVSTNRAATALASLARNQDAAVE